MPSSFDFLENYGQVFFNSDMPRYLLDQSATAFDDIGIKGCGGLVQQLLRNRLDRQRRQAQCAHRQALFDVTASVEAIQGRADIGNDPAGGVRHQQRRSVGIPGLRVKPQAEADHGADAEDDDDGEAVDEPLAGESVHDAGPFHAGNIPVSAHRQAAETGQCQRGQIYLAGQINLSPLGLG